MTDQPLYEHDCTSCVFLGNFESEGDKYDLYYCPGGGYPTVIARYGSEGSHYSSGIEIARTGHCPHLGEALRRAREREFEVGDPKPVIPVPPDRTITVFVVRNPLDVAGKLPFAEVDEKGLPVHPVDVVERVRQFVRDGVDFATTVELPVLVIGRMIRRAEIRCNQARVLFQRDGEVRHNELDIRGDFVHCDTDPGFNINFEERFRS